MPSHDHVKTADSEGASVQTIGGLLPSIGSKRINEQQEPWEQVRSKQP